MRIELKNIYRRVALWLCLCMMVGIMPASSEGLAVSKPTVKLIIVGKYVTKKTYKVKNKLRRQLNVKTNNTFGKTTIKYTSANKKIATVNKNGFITTKKAGTVKITVKVTCKRGKKKRSTTTWTKLKVLPDDGTSSPTPSPTAQIDGAMRAVLVVNGPNARQFPMTILDNEAGRLLYNNLPKTLRYMTDENKNVKSVIDPDGLYFPMEEYKPNTLKAGDFMLYGNSKYELTYEDHSSGYEYTRLGRIMDPTGLKEAVGTGPVSITIIKSSLPSTATPVPTLTPKPSASASASPWPSGVPTPTGSVSPSPSGSPNPSASVKPSGSPGASTSPNPSASVKPSGSPTPTTIPEYNGPRIRIEVNGQDYVVAVNQSSKAAMALYNKLSKDKEYTVAMKPFNADRYVGMFDSGLSTEENTKSITNWPTGSVVLIGNYIYIFKKTVSNMGADGTGVDACTILATVDTTTMDKDSIGGYLRTMFNGIDDLNVKLWKY